MKKFHYLFVVAAALSALSVPAQAEQVDSGHVAKVLTTVPVTYRDPSVINADLRNWVPPKHAWLDASAKAHDMDPIFYVRAALRDVHVAGITQINLGGGSGGITYADSGGGSQCIDHLKSGRFTVGGGYLIGAGESVAMTGKDLSG